MTDSQIFLAEISQGAEEEPAFDCSSCGPRAVCALQNGQVKCSCLDELIGKWPDCKGRSCGNSSECGNYQTCSVTGECINPCELNPCNEGAFCVVSPDHSFRCLCPLGHEEDGRNGCWTVSTRCELSAALSCSKSRFQFIHSSDHSIRSMPEVTVR
jgi:hypothetical protein